MFKFFVIFALVAIAAATPVPEPAPEPAPEPSTIIAGAAPIVYRTGGLRTYVGGYDPLLRGYGALSRSYGGYVASPYYTNGLGYRSSIFI